MGAGFPPGLPVTPLSSQVPSADSLTNATLTTQQQFATTYSVPANTFAAGPPATGIRVVAEFEITQPAATSPTVTLAAKLGSNIWATGAMSPSNALNSVHVQLTLLILGGPATDQVVVLSDLGPMVPGATSAQMIDNTAQPVAVTWNAAHTLALFCTFSNTTATATVKLLGLFVEPIG